MPNITCGLSIQQSEAIIFIGSIKHVIFHKGWIVYHEPNNAFDQFAIKMVIMEKNREKIVGHSPREISRPTKFLLVRGAVIHAEISSVKSRHSPLVQGGLELSCKVSVSMPPTVLNENLISRYKSLVASSYVKPPKEAEVGSFEREQHQTDFSIKGTKKGVQVKLKRKSQQNAPEEAKPDEKELPQSREIRSFFVFKGAKTSKRD